MESNFGAKVWTQHRRNFRSPAFPNPGKTSAPPLMLAAAKIWLRAYGPAVAILDFASFCSRNKMKHLTWTHVLFFYGAIGATFSHVYMLLHRIHAGLEFMIVSNLGTIAVSKLAADLACDSE